MKYIRTKDGVYDTSKGIYAPSIKMWAIGTVTIYDEDILKQADTIEELCDEVVFYAKGFIKPQVYDKLQKKEIAVMKQMVNSTIEDVKLYYAIWTSKGLIYVAKMNKNGVLCLI